MREKLQRCRELSSGQVKGFRPRGTEEGAKNVALPKSSADLSQCKQTPQDIGYYQRPDAGGHKGAEGSFHQVGEDAGDENEEEGDRGEKKSGTGEVGMGHAQSDEK